MQSLTVLILVVLSDTYLPTQHWSCRFPISSYSFRAHCTTHGSAVIMWFAFRSLCCSSTRRAQLTFRPIHKVSRDEFCWATKSKTNVVPVISRSRLSTGRGQKAPDRHSTPLRRSPDHVGRHIPPFLPDPPTQPAICALTTSWIDAGTYESRHLGEIPRAVTSFAHHAPFLRLSI